MSDFDIPKQYGLRQTIGDTLGVGGIMRGLRTVPHLWTVADDMARLCPDAIARCDEMEGKTGHRPHAMRYDPTDTTALKVTLAEAAEVNGPVTVLVNNAANDKLHTTERALEEFRDWMQAINLRCYFFACHAVNEGMRAAGVGSIFNLSSIC